MKTGPEKTASKNLIASVEKAAALLLLFSENQTEELSILELSKKMDIPKTTVHRVVATLIQHSLLEQNQENKKYRLGISTFLLGSRYLETHTLERVARGYLPLLVKLSGESVSISMLDGNESVIIDKLDGFYSMRTISQIGKRNPLYCSGSGKVFLGMMEPRKRRALLETMVPLEKFTPFTITDINELERDVDRIHKLGYIYEDEEFHLEQICISSPVFNHTGEVCAAITISGPKPRIMQKGIDVIGNQLKAVCHNVSKDIGYRAE